jgi:hypothetical protein
MTSVQAEGVSGKSSPGFDQVANKLTPVGSDPSKSLFAEYYRNLYVEQSAWHDRIDTDFSKLSPSYSDETYTPFTGQYVGRLMVLQSVARMESEGKVPRGTLAAILNDPQVKKDLEFMKKFASEIPARHSGGDPAKLGEHLGLIYQACQDLGKVGDCASSGGDVVKFWSTFDWDPYTKK